MIGFVTVGTNDLARASAFFDALFATIGAKRLTDGERFKSWGMAPGTPRVAVVKPYDGSAATTGNGTMVALAMESREQVEAMHAKALALGGADEGPVGLRGETFYAGYFRDLDGNKFVAFKVG
jgi:hypothetical protein